MMLKINKIVGVLLLCIAGNTALAQTKEETINWLKEKLEMSIVASNSYVKDIRVENFSECGFTVKYIHSTNYFDKYYHFTIPANGLTFDENRKFRFDLQAIKRERLEDKTGSAVVEKDYLFTVPYIEVANSEVDLHNRIVKAFKHLATFCPQKKEAF